MGNQSSSREVKSKARPEALVKEIVVGGVDG